MSKTYLKRIKAKSCTKCYFALNGLSCDKVYCNDAIRYQKITERTAKRLLKQGWKIALS